MVKKNKNLHLDDIRSHLRSAEQLCEEKGVPFVAAIEKESGALFKYSAATDKSGERLVNAAGNLAAERPAKAKGDNMPNMTKTSGTKIQRALSTVRTEGTEALWRTAATQTVMAVHAPILAALKRQHLSEGVIEGIRSFLETDIGRATIAVLLGTALQNIPTFGNNPKVQRLASEIRIYGMTTCGNVVANIVMDPIRGVLTDLISAIPEEAPEQAEEVEVATSERSSSMRIAE